jgi:hypothetical protein
MFARLATSGPVSTAIQHGGAGAEVGPDLAGQQALGACGLVEAPDRLVGRAEDSRVTQQRRLVTDDHALGLRRDQCLDRRRDVLELMLIGQKRAAVVANPQCLASIVSLMRAVGAGKPRGLVPAAFCLVAECKDRTISSTFAIDCVVTVDR